MGKRYLLVAKDSFGINTTYFYTNEEAKFKTTQADIDNIWEISDEDIKKAIDEVINNPLLNQLFNNLSKND